MPDVNALMALVQAHLPWHRARLFTLCALVVALLRLRTVCLTALAATLHPKRSAETNYRRLQRFFALFCFDFEALAELLLALRISEEPLVLVMDRTEWHFGARTINLLVVGYLEAGITVPLLWKELDKAGATSEEERIALMKRLLPLVEPRRVEALVADREFIGGQFFAWLCRQNFRFVIRIRKNARLYHRGRRTTRRAGEVFAALAEGEEQRLRDRHLVYDTHVYVVAARQGEDPWILVTNARPAQARALYRKRWAVETMFGAMKSRGFDLEATHLRQGDRIEKLIGVLALALVWALRVGLWRVEQVALVVKKHGRRAKSLFRHGLDYLREHLLNHNWAALRPAFHVLSCT
jgi:transposase